MEGANHSGGADDRDRQPRPEPLLLHLPDLRVIAVDPQELLTPDQVCALLKMKRTWFYAQVARGVFRPIKLGRSTRVRRRDLEAYLSGLERAGESTAPAVRSAETIPAQVPPTDVVRVEQQDRAGRRTRLQSVPRSPQLPPNAARTRHQQLTLPDRAGS